MADDVETPDTIGDAPTAGSSPDDELGSAASLLRGLADAPGRPVGAGGPLRDGQMIAGKYRIERAIGEGGMGVVYRARDMRLERDVALKVGSAVSAAALARSQREAQALARLSHPNVVVVYEVGEVEGRVFVAMEHVAGGTARAWTAIRRTPAQIVALYGAAGDGLAAAHAAGIVHRDFKPDNVLVGDDGRPRVADFGLARGAAGGLDDVAPHNSSPLADVSQAGAVVGTPAYMAPEQLLGTHVDARADQFAFCAALWEALTGERASRSTVAARSRKVPRHVEAALRRGLRDDPEERWPSMAALLVELRRDPARRRRTLLLAIGGAVAIAAALILPRALASTDDPCATAGDAIAATWTPARAAKVRAAFAALHQDWAAATAARAITDLDAKAAQLAVANRAVCEASSATWSAQLRDKGVVCLDRRRLDLAATADVLGAADVATAARARDLIASIGSPDACANPAYVVTEVAPPTDPRVIAAVGAIDPMIARAEALGRAGEIAEARTLAAAMVPAAIATGDPASAARVRVTLGAALSHAHAYASALPILTDAYFGARDVGDVRTATAAAATSTHVAIGLSRLDEATMWSRLAGVEAHASSDPQLRVAVDDAATLVARVRNRLDDGRALAEHQLADARALGEPSMIAQALFERASVRGELGEQTAAIGDLREAMRVIRAGYGDQHPQLVDLGANLSFALRREGHYDDAIAEARAALALAERVFGTESANANVPRGDLALSLAAAGKTDAALALWTDVLRIDRAQLGVDQWDYGSDLNNYGLLLEQLDRNGEAIAAFREVAAVWTKIAGADSEDVALILGNLAEVEATVGHLDDAEADASRAIAIFSKRPDGQAIAYPLMSRGDARLTRGDVAGARADLERALAIRSKLDVEPDLLAESQVLVADAAARTGDTGDAARARELIAKAVPVLRTSDDAPMLARAAAIERRLGAPPIR